MYGDMFSPALLASAPTLFDSWLTAIGNAKVLIAVWLFGLAVYIGVFLRWQKRRRDAELRAVAEDQSFATVSDDGQTIIVYAKKSRVALYMLRHTTSIGVFVAFNAWLLFDPRFQRSIVEIAIFVLITGAALLFSAIPLLLGAARFFSSAPILIVNAEGITDNSTLIATGMGLIPWREIRQLFIYDPHAFLPILPTRKLTIATINQAIVRRQARWKRAIHALNPSASDIVSIPEFLLPMPLEELQAQIEEHLRIHRYVLPLSQAPFGADTATSAD